MKHVSKILLSLCVLLISTSVFSQDTIQKNLPKKNIDVKREYDKDGNLIRYDSTYVYSWSSDSTYHFMPDSVFLNFSDIHEMRKEMQERMQHFFKRDTSVNKSFHHPFFSDDFFDKDFFDKDFFDPQFNRKNFFYRDSSHREFFKDLEEMIEGHQFFRQERNKGIHKDLDSLHNEFIKERKEYFRKRDSIYRKHSKEKSNNIDI